MECISPWRGGIGAVSPVSPGDLRGCHEEKAARGVI